MSTDQLSPAQSHLIAEPQLRYCLDQMSFWVHLGVQAMMGGTNRGQVALGSVRNLAEHEPMGEVMKQHLPLVPATIPCSD